jgi:hypothetical protein
MGTAIADSTRRLMAGLDRGTRLRAEVSAGTCSRQALGCELTLGELLELLLAAKVLAVGDDFERGEAQGVRMWLTRHGMPMVVQRHVLDVDPAQLELGELHERLVAGGLYARWLLWLVVTLASFEGLRAGPRARAEALGERLGLPPALVRVLVEEARITVSALLSGDDPLLRRLTELRAAIFALEPDSARSP